MCCPVQVYKCDKLTLLCADEHISCNCHTSNVCSITLHYHCITRITGFDFWIDHSPRGMVLWIMMNSFVNQRDRDLSITRSRLIVYYRTTFLPYVQIGSEPTEQEYLSYYECPLYLTPARRHFITSFSLPTNVQPDHWTLQRVALFTVIWLLELFICTWFCILHIGSHFDYYCNLWLQKMIEFIYPAIQMFDLWHAGSLYCHAPK